MRRFQNGREIIAKDKALQAIGLALIPEDDPNPDLKEVSLTAKWGNDWLIKVDRSWADGTITEEVIAEGEALWYLVMDHRRSYGILDEDTQEVYIPWYQFELVMKAHSGNVNCACAYTYVGEGFENLALETLLIDLAEFPRDHHDLNGWFTAALGMEKRV